MNEKFDLQGPKRDFFYRVIAFHETPDLIWEMVSEEVPLLPKAWFELSRLPTDCRLEFTKDYWIYKLPFFDSIAVDRLENFFDQVEDIGIYAIQTMKGLPFDLHMVYALKGNEGFFQGGPPASVETIDTLVKQFSHVNLPDDYVAFLQLHDGFSKYIDTGLIKTREMSRTYLKLQQALIDLQIEGPDGERVFPEQLIPFYESYGLHHYQCFYADWYPNKDMGNVAFSLQDLSISNFLDRHKQEDELAFTSFLEWFLFYIEDVW